MVRCICELGWRPRIERRLLGHLADLAFAPARHLEESLRQLDGLCLRLRVDDRVAADYLFRFGEGPVDNLEAAVGIHSHARALRAVLKPVGLDEDAGLCELL